MSAVAHAEASESYSEKTAFAEILAWSIDRPAWQRDALRRLVQHGALDASDIEDLAKIALNSEAAFSPISAEHVDAEAVVREAVALVRIEDPTGVNALAEKQKLEFAQNGLTIIYGDNGSGKSGYVRILKHACRSRDRATKILPDVEAASPAPQAAKIVFKRGAADVEFDWSPTAAGHPDLPSVSIFDSKSASIHVEKNNAVAYIPQPMQVLEALAGACDAVKARLDRDLGALSRQTPIALKAPTLKLGTAAGAFVRNLSAASNLAQLDLLSSLSDEERQRLAQLEADLAQDPSRAAARVNALKVRLDAKTAALKRLIEVSSPSAFVARDASKAAWDAKAEAARLASEALFAASPLPDVGKATWKSLWEAARKYANETAHPQKSFPSAEPGDLCVLCQQPLEEAAIARWSTFEAFIKGATKTEEAEVANAHEAMMKQAAAARVTMSGLSELTTLIATELGDVTLAESVRAAGIKAAWRLRALLGGLAAPGDAPVYPESAITKASTALAARSAQLSADQKSPEHQALVKALEELKDREAMAGFKDDIKAEIERKAEAEAIGRAVKDTATNAITSKNKAISDQLVTNALRNRFAREIEKLRLARMPVELRKTKDQSAVSFFQVALVANPNEPVGDIFSEGEHRCVALAAFLTELVTSKQYSGIVFDDPMSSLDHIHRRAVAARLVEEAAHRQVIVFTHDLTFLYELRREAEVHGRPVLYQTVERKLDRPGHVEGELPTKAKSALDLAHALRVELKAEKGHFPHWSDMKRTLFCKGVIEQLREVWDQGLADFIFPVLARFDNQIKGTSLYKLAVLTDPDVQTVTAARRRLSDGLHVSAETLNPEAVAHAALVDEVAKLETWLTDMKKRQQEATPPA